MLSLPLYETVQASSVATKEQGFASSTEELEGVSATLEELATSELDAGEDLTELEDSGSLGFSGPFGEELSPHAIKHMATDIERPRPIFL